MQGKLLRNRNYLTDLEEAEAVSVCSCTCLGGTRCMNHETFHDPDIRPTHEILTSTFSLKRASV